MRLNTESREILDRVVEVEAGGVLDAGRDDCLGEVEALLVEALEHVPEVVIFGVNLCARHVVAAEEHAGPLLRGARLALLDDLDAALGREREWDVLLRVDHEAVLVGVSSSLAALRAVRLGLGAVAASVALRVAVNGWSTPLIRVARGWSGNNKPGTDWCSEL